MTAAHPSAPPAGHTPPAASAPHSAEHTARRVEELLDRVAHQAGPEAAGAAEELVRALMDFYGTGLARMVALLSGRSGSPLAPLLDDEVTAGLLVLHDLHPDDTLGRIGRALRAAGAHQYEVTGFDQDSGVLRLSAPSGGCGCGGGAPQDVRERAEAALSCFAPEVTRVETAEPGPPPPVLLQIAPGPPGATAGGPR
ncbi:hypothetical protein [Streptomyces sp. NPDC050560]|uniref:hypothetical protein n=1 Tax=Streptomyces sp. NPDC050560 TaxID=3365630 RepID=UPI0037A94270